MRDTSKTLSNHRHMWLAVALLASVIAVLLQSAPAGALVFDTVDRLVDGTVRPIWRALPSSRRPTQPTPPSTPSPPTPPETSPAAPTTPESVSRIPADDQPSGDTPVMSIRQQQPVPTLPNDAVAPLQRDFDVQSIGSDRPKVVSNSEPMVAARPASVLGENTVAGSSRVSKSSVGSLAGQTALVVAGLSLVSLSPYVYAFAVKSRTGRGAG